MSRYLAEKAATGSFDLESFEMSIRSSMHHIGRGLLEQIINADGGGYLGLGQEDLYELAGLHVEAKAIERVSRMVGDQVESFHACLRAARKQAGEAKAALSDDMPFSTPVPRMYICMDGTGVPVVKRETVGRRRKGEDGQSKTREVKLGCVFTKDGG